MHHHGDLGWKTLKVKKLLELFIKKTCKIQVLSFELKKVTKKNVNRPYIKWKGYANFVSI